MHGKRGILRVLFLVDHGNRWRWVVSVTFRLLYHQERAPVPIVEEAVGALYVPFIRHMSPASYLAVV
jgi:hypothetical protein